MPPADLFHFFQEDLTLRQQRWVNGMHYAKTSENRLSKMGTRRIYGTDQAAKWFYRWQIFMACAELLAYRRGDPWGACHHLLRSVSTFKRSIWSKNQREVAADNNTDDKSDVGFLVCFVV